MKSLLFICLLGTCVPALANTSVEPLVTRSSVTDQQLYITLANLQQQTTYVQVRRLDDDQVYLKKRVSKHNGYRASIELSDMPNGRYLIEVKKDDTLRQQVVVKTDHGLLCSAWK
jgi:hypothetical protein